MSDTTYTIGALCHAFGVTARALRFYEAKGLLRPGREGQKRLFTASDRARLKLILRGKRFGFSLDELRDLLDLYEIGDGQITQLSATLEAAERHRGELIARRDDLDSALSDLDAQIAMLRRMLAERGQARASG